ncbi:CD40L protein, partial [Odontophorus gujanensis]|nr:CD40L protein [Odontophorus gujanensis]
MNEAYSSAAPRPMGSTSPSTMKMFMCFLAVFMVVQTIGTVLFCLYLHMKMDKMEEVLSLNEDYIFLRKVQKCQTGEGQKSTLLDCEKVLKGFQDLQCKVDGCWVDTAPAEGGGSIPGTHKAPPKAFLKTMGEPSPAHGAVPPNQPPRRDLSQLNSHIFSPVLEWKTTSYAPTNSLITYHGGKLKVEKAGLYYIYSQVSFCTKAAASAPFTLYIYLYLPMEEDRLLMKGLDTHSTSTALCELQSIREGGVFELREGDMVFVNVTDSTLVNPNPGNTYFGMFKL